MKVFKMGRLNNKCVFLCCGCLGFIGSHFIEKVLALGHKVINFDSETYAANLGMTFQGDYHYVKCDIATIDSLPFCDIIVNFAAESHVDNSIANASNFINTNVMGVHNLLELIKRNKIQNMLVNWSYSPPLFIQISTDEVFGDILSGYFSEGDRHLPSNPYSATKSCAEMLVHAWGRTYGIPYIITRTTNNYGKRQHAEKLIPATITKLLNNQKVIVHGDGRYIRNWIHVNDNVSAILKIIDLSDVNSVYHISSDEEYSVKEIVTMIAENMNVKYDDIIDTSSDRSGCDERYALDCSKLKSLGWTQQFHLKDELPNLIKFFKDRQ